MLKEETACLTGHRPKSLPWGYDEEKENCKRFKSDLIDIFTGGIEYGLKTFLIGMAEGFDMIGGETLIELRKRHKEIKIIAVVPCKDQEIKWKPEQQKRYRNLLKKCDDVIILQENYTADCMNKRNKYMVDNSSVVIACYNGKPSGTGNTIRFAKENGCKIRIIDINKY
ncbi:MAG: SLOG family protein [Christensenellales bacterium]